ncbi:phosphoglucomutase-2 [Tothia fuscella]|uniref:Phosphoglucomutase-2 n=1 Tax=Tothia fuscella TaxID=1048955 RepID=A0A9P4NHZ2_9PEZI|nr:phosphoglucomutase-2 [Tothia fuscella]
MTSIKDLADEWLRIDQDSITKDEIQTLVAQDQNEELEKRLRTRIAFGTAGLRARMEAGFSRMNCVTVIQASQGLAAYLLKSVPDMKHKGVVIGRDARHNSKKFAKLTAAAFVEKDIKVWWFEEPTHTPLVPFGVRELHAAAGVMITASHNPASDNGYKVYWGNGCQIIPPHDRGIAQSILENLEPISWDTSVVSGSLLVEGALGLVEDAYYRAVCAAADPNGHLAKAGDLHLKYAYTAMHGVGLRYMEKALAALGLGRYMQVVEEQAHPDPNFPSVKFPNPEEKGALDVAMSSADRHSISLILASDPDADRLAVAEKVDGKWHQFTGNQLGILLASHVLDTYIKPRDKLAMLASTVSSRMLGVMAEKEGFHFVETLTGFKWMGNIALDLDEAGYDSRFAFEEAIGYMIPGVVHDKDAVAAAATFLTAVVRWQKDGLTPFHKLHKLYEKYGHFEDANTYVISRSPAVTEQVFNAVRALGAPYPKTLGKRKVHRWRDLTKGWDSATNDHKPVLPADKTSQMITCELEGDVRFTVRGSGTEPKIKFYIECKAHSRDKAKKGADEVLADLLKEWFKPEKYGLVLA